MHRRDIYDVPSRAIRQRQVRDVQGLRIHLPVDQSGEELSKMPWTYRGSAQHRVGEIGARTGVVIVCGENTPRSVGRERIRAAWSLRGSRGVAGLAPRDQRTDHTTDYTETPPSQEQSHHWLRILNGSH